MNEDDLFSELQAVPAEPVVPNHRASKDPFDPSPGDGPTRGRNIFQRAAKGDAKPSVTRAKRQTSPPPPVVKGEFIEPLTDLYNTIGIALMPFKPQVAIALVSPARDASEEEKAKGIDPPTVAENCARAWDEVAQKNESVRRALKTMTTVGVWGGLFMAHAPILMAIMADTPLGERLNPAAGAEAFLRSQAGPDES